MGRQDWRRGLRRNSSAMGKVIDGDRNQKEWIMLIYLQNFLRKRVKRDISVYPYCLNITCLVPKVYKFGLLFILFRSKNVTNSWKQQYFCIDSNTLIDLIALIEQYFYTLINQSYFVTKHMVWKEFRLERHTFYFLYFVLTMQGWENM